jgi:hypothetical protein
MEGMISLFTPGRSGFSFSSSAIPIERELAKRRILAGVRESGKAGWVGDEQK